MPALADLVEGVPALAGRVQSAAKLSELMARNQLPQICPAAFVLPLGIGGGTADAVTGLFRQSITRLHGVLLAVRSAGDATGAAGLVQLDPLIEGVIAAVVGMDADNEIGGVFTLAKGQLASLEQGTITYQLDFTVEDQLRIPR